MACRFLGVSDASFSEPKHWDFPATNKAAAISPLDQGQGEADEKSSGERTTGGDPDTEMAQLNARLKAK
jgi:hypothetical protein